MIYTQEFQRQVDNLIAKNYPQETGLTEAEFLKFINPLLEKLQTIELIDTDLDKGHLPFVIVIKKELIDSEKAMSLVEKDGKEGITKLYPREANDFETLKELSIPDEKAYLLIDIDRGKENINLPPGEAFELIKKENRSPLTIDEGIAIVTQFPDFLIKNNCFSLLGSRITDDLRVPAIWINSNKNPNLGWCWNGNPHTWLGSASCRIRL